MGTATRWFSRILGHTVAASHILLFDADTRVAEAEPCVRSGDSSR